MERAMSRRFAVALLSAGLLVLFGPWTLASADDDNDNGNGNGSISSCNCPTTDFAFFDGTGAEAGPNGGAECTVNGPATLHASVSNLGLAGFVRLRYNDDDFVQFPIMPAGVLQLNQAIGGNPDASFRVRLSNGGSGAILTGALSAIGQVLLCQSCSTLDGGGPPGCLNNP
jgi:hypothetical protein